MNNNQAAENIKDTAALLKFREKRKWQIALRRYVIEKALSKTYAPYFGLDIKNMRLWFEYQFTNGIGWESFGKEWQFDHIIPVTYFDFTVEDELRLCWNFTNIRVEAIQKNKERGARLDVLAAKGYFKRLFEETGYEVCQKLLEKIDIIELSEFVSTDAQRNFISTHKEYLKMIKGYTAFEFELLNIGRTIEEVNKEIDILRKFGS
jgi:hypothetical protein